MDKSPTLAYTWHPLFDANISEVNFCFNHNKHILHRINSEHDN